MGGRSSHRSRPLLLLIRDSHLHARRKKRGGECGWLVQHISGELLLRSWKSKPIVVHLRQNRRSFPVRLRAARHRGHRVSAVRGRDHLAFPQAHVRPVEFATTRCSAGPSLRSQLRRSSGASLSLWRNEAFGVPAPICDGRCHHTSAPFSYQPPRLCSSASPSSLLLTNV